MVGMGVGGGSLLVLYLPSIGMMNLISKEGNLV